MRSRVSLQTAFVVASAVLAAGLLEAQQRTSPVFLPDDPIAVDADGAADAGAARRDGLGGYADFVTNMFFMPETSDVPAMNVNTLDEVPDSSWFTNRIGARTMPLAEIVRGPDRVERLDVREWVIVEGKDSGRQPGFRAIDPADPARTVYQLEFDPRGNPEMATGAEIIGTAVYHALGYNVVDVYLVNLTRDALRIAPEAVVHEAGGTRRFRKRDLDRLLRNVARNADGSYRATASRFADGEPLGPFRYAGVRPDDPNDIVPHQHRRELRGNRVFSAWLNHDDSRAINSLDMRVGPEGRQHVKHYMFDFGSMLGSGTNEEDLPWVGHEHVFEPRQGLLTLASFGFYRRPFISVKAPRGLPAAGNFTADRFDPAGWRPHYPNAAFNHMRADDAFWAARKLAALSPDAIAAIVGKAGFSDPAVRDHMIGTLIRRRAKVLAAWLTAVNPIASPRVDGGRLRFTNAAVDAGVAEPEADYDVQWFRYDNARGVRELVSSPVLMEETWAAIPEAALEGAGYAGVEIRTLHGDHPGWRAPVRIYLRRNAGGWEAVGVERTLGEEAARVARR